MSVVEIFVCAPATGPNLVDVGGSCPNSDFRMEPIGRIIGRGPTIVIDDIESARAALPGLEIKYLVRGVRAAHGCMGAQVNFAVEVSGWEEANKVPGFEPFGDWSGAFFNIPRSVMGLTGNGWHNVSDHFEDFDPPPYASDGSFVVSLIPLGVLGRMVFLEERPDSFYVMHGGERLGTDADVVSLVRSP